MTTIRDMTAPAIDGERRQSRTENGGVRIVVVLAVSAVLMTVMNLTAAIYLYRASGQVKLVQKQLDELSAFETRLKGRLDLVNTGIQSQFDRLNRDLPARFDEIYGGIDRLEKSVNGLEAGAANGIGPLDEAELAIDLPPVLAEPEAKVDAALEPEAVAKPPRPKRSAAKPVPAPSSAYKRVESPDGKVYYRKVR